MDYTIWFTPIMCILISLLISSIDFIFHFLTLLSNIIYVNLILGLKQSPKKVSHKVPKAHWDKSNHSDGCSVSKISAFVDTNTLTFQRLDKPHPKVRLKLSIFYHRPRLKSPKTLPLADHIKEMNLPKVDNTK